MEDMSPAVAVTLSLGNSVCDNSAIATNVEFAWLKLVADPGNLSSDTTKLVPVELISNESCNDTRNEVSMVTMQSQQDNGGGADLLTMLPKNGNSVVVNDSVVQESEEDEILSFRYDTNGIVNEKLLTLEVGSEISLTDVVEIGNAGEGQIVAKAIVLVESTIGQVHSGEVIVAAVTPVSELSGNTELAASTAVLLQSNGEKNVTKAAIRSVFELDCIPLWGSVSICGRRPEMEDAIAAVPRFINIPIKMLIGNHVYNGMNQSLTHLTSHFFGIYDGHGGPQVYIFFHTFILFIHVKVFYNATGCISENLLGLLTVYLYGSMISK